MVEIISEIVNKIQFHLLSFLQYIDLSFNHPISATVEVF